jgi:hypothetical protein
MANLIKWNVDSTTKVTVFAGASTDSQSDLCSKPTAKTALSGTIENTDGSQYAMFELRSQTQASSVSGYYEVWLLRSLNGADFEDGTGTTSTETAVVPARAPDCIIPVRDLSTTQQILVTNIIPIPPQDFKVLVRNSTGQTTTATTNATPNSALCSMFILMFNDEVQ